MKSPAKIKHIPEPYGSNKELFNPFIAISSVALISVPAPNHVANKQKVESHKENDRPPTKKSSLLSVLEFAKHPTPKRNTKNIDNVIENELFIA